MKYFEFSEFDSPDLAKSGVNMDRRFLTLLDRVRSDCGFVFKVNSGYRTKEHNKKVGGKENSAHLRGYAVDIKIISSLQRFSILKYALKQGITRVGFGDNFVHLDIDPDKPNEVLWIY